MDGIEGPGNIVPQTERDVDLDLDTEVLTPRTGMKLLYEVVAVPSGLCWLDVGVI